MSAAVSHFVLTDEMVEEFYREGYFYAPGFITPETVEAINEEQEAFANGSGGGEWRSNPFTHYDKHGLQYPATARMLRDPKVVGVLEGVLGDAVRLWMGMYAVVPPRGKGLEWHQDNQYTHILGHMLNGFIALDAITQENAGLWIAPRSHRLGRQPNLDEGGAHRRAAVPENGMPCKPMKPGDAVFFHRETLHHSKGNHTDKPRRAFAFQASSYTARYAETGKPLLDRELLSSNPR
ncbi:phytanoyl-CoA dioxygenase family protein [Paenibacillus spongiae]|uniref:Phytanoyl-CoA dioxygenase family protein n=1 Tax=Paenibacillus spongiae TaxID=2909671 RepID=A0ABY5S9N9_9BACL|nr:phytanoyl-CoA dioxygenase family protein [Paenibacillus spongiae]UVI30639.1 phytanoyl-CoA dioxygenase family protein [Paenibacillus spongiae]